jgi:hypothetical protein
MSKSIYRAALHHSEVMTTKALIRFSPGRLTRVIIWVVILEGSCATAGWALDAETIAALTICWERGETWQYPFELTAQAAKRW